MQSKTNVDKHFPDKVFYEALSILLLYVRTQITVLAVLHNDVNFRVYNERVKISNYKVTIQV